MPNRSAPRRAEFVMARWVRRAPFGGTGRPGGEDDQGDVVGVRRPPADLPRRRRAERLPGRKRDDLAQGGERRPDRRHHAHHLGVAVGLDAEHARRRRGRQNVAELGGPKGGVDRDQDQSGQGGGVGEEPRHRRHQRRPAAAGVGGRCGGDAAGPGCAGDSG